MIPSAKFQQLLQEAFAHHQGGRLARAEAIYRQLMAAAPRNAQVVDLLGQLATQQGRAADALRLFHQAWQLDERAVPVAVRLASALISAERTADAEKVLRRLTQKNPQSADGWNALAYTLKVQGRLTDAVECHERAVKLNPNFLEGWYHYGLTLASLGKNFQGLHCHERALAINPRYARARFGRAQALHKIYRLEEAIADYDAFLKAEPHHHEARSYRLFALQNLDGISRERLFAEHCAYGKAVGAGPATLPGYDTSPDRRLRVAILSPDLRTHSCAYFLEPLLRQLDPREFELYLYHDHFSEDEVSARLRGLAAVWRNFVGQPQAAVERAIRADKPDLLIDLTGHIGMTVRLPIFARRLAPVQITYLGYPDTTGVAAMDYRFTDAIADPPGESDRLHTEKLVRFAPTAWCYQPPADAPAVAVPPCATWGGARCPQRAGSDAEESALRTTEAAGRQPATRSTSEATGQAVTFGCFSSPTKFTASLFAAWARLLATVPGSRLLLKGRDFEENSVRDDMLGRLARAGVPMDRLELLPRTAGTTEHLALYNRVDVALDTFPYAGTTTTCEALWMGRPVVTLGGDRHAARVGASLLNAVGHPEWIATNVDDYVRIAAQLVSEPASLAVTATSLREQMRGSALMDEVSQGRRFAAALRRCWQERVAATTTAAPAVSAA